MSQSGRVGFASGFLHISLIPNVLQFHMCANSARVSTPPVIPVFWGRCRKEVWKECAPEGLLAGGGRISPCHNAHYSAYFGRCGRVALERCAAVASGRCGALQKEQVSISSYRRIYRGRLIYPGRPLIYPRRHIVFTIVRYTGSRWRQRGCCRLNPLQ